MVIQKYKKYTNPLVPTANLTASELIQLLKDGNNRFINETFQNQNLQNLLNESCKGQDPFITILGCVWILESPTKSYSIYIKEIYFLFELQEIL